MAPTFSIVMSTYNRGRHILPTIKSVLAQSFADYELMIVGDGCDDETGAVVRPFLSERVRWTNLPKRSGSQSAPNNAAIQQARGRYVAYLGHDDVWAPGHLAALHQAFAASPDASFAISGCVCYGPPGSGHHLVTGLFESDEARFKFFFPPSSFAHRIDVTSRIGPWAVAGAIKRPVDADLLLRAAEGGMTFVSTGEITVHKFATGGRYLAYAKQSSTEQELIARMMAERTLGPLVEQVVARSREIDTFGLRHPDYTKVAEGEYHQRLGIIRGILRPPLLPLDGHAVMLQDDDIRSLDWGRFAIEGTRRVRWSSLNPRPKILLPFTAGGTTRLRFMICDTSDDDVIGKVRLSVNGVPTASRIWNQNGRMRRAVLQCEASLPPGDYTIIEFDLTGGMPLEELVWFVGGRPERIALGEITLRPEQAAQRGVIGFAARVAKVVQGLTKH